VVGAGWPAVTVRQNMLAEAVPIIRRLLDGELVTTGGEYLRVDSARLWDLPEHPVEIGVAVSGAQSIQRFAPLGDHLVAVEPDTDAIANWDAVRSDLGLPPSRKVGQIPISWGPDREAAIERAHELFRWFGAGWDVNADLPTRPGSLRPASSSGPATSPTPSRAARISTNWSTA